MAHYCPPQHPPHPPSPKRNNDNDKKIRIIKNEKKANAETVAARIKVGEVEIAAENIAFNKSFSDSCHFQRSSGSNYVMHKLFGYWS